MTVLFCDVVGSTELGERLDPESLRRVLARYFSTVRTVIERHGGRGGEIHRRRGDGGLRRSGPPRGRRPARGPRSGRPAGGARSVERRIARDYETVLSLRVGINTGEVVTGTEERLATGDAVNVAARLEQRAGAGEILLGEATLAARRDSVDVEPLPAIELKGKRSRVRAWRLGEVHDEGARRLSSGGWSAARTRPAPPGGVRGLGHTLSCQLVTVVGDAGVGKSVGRGVPGAAFRGVLILEGRCLPYGDGITYWPVVEVVRQLEDNRPACARSTRVARRSGLLGEPDFSSIEEIAWAMRQVLEAAAEEITLVVRARRRPLGRGDVPRSC